MKKFKSVKICFILIIAVIALTALPFYSLRVSAKEQTSSTSDMSDMEGMHHDKDCEDECENGCDHQKEMECCQFGSYTMVSVWLQHDNGSNLDENSETLFDRFNKFQNINSPPESPPPKF